MGDPEESTTKVSFTLSGGARLDPAVEPTTRGRGLVDHRRVTVRISRARVPPKIVFERGTVPWTVLESPSFPKTFRTLESRWWSGRGRRGPDLSLSVPLTRGKGGDLSVQGRFSSSSRSLFSFFVAKTGVRYHVTHGSDTTVPSGPFPLLLRSLRRRRNPQ